MIGWLTDWITKGIERSKLDAAIDDREERITELLRQVRQTEDQIKELKAKKAAL